MEKDPQNTQQEGQSAPADNPQQHNPKNLFKDDAPVRELSAEEEAEQEQQRKEALTERD